MGKQYDEESEDNQNQQENGSGILSSDASNKFRSMNDVFSNSNHSSENAASKPGNGFSNSGTSSGVSGSASAGGTSLGGTAGGTATTAGSSVASSAAGGIAGGAASGAAAGSVVPGAGTLAGAAIGAVGSSAKKAAETAAQQETEKVINEKTSKKIGEQTGKKESAVDDSIGMKAAAIGLGIILLFLFFATIIINFFVGSVASPVMNSFKQVCTGKELDPQFIEDCGTTAPTYEQIVLCFDSRLKDTMIDAYKYTCFKEVYQIAIEQEYDLELTIESYNNTEIPYIFDGDNCNVNFAEIINIISMSPEFKTVYTEFDYQSFLELLNNDEFRRCLYDLTVTRAEKKIFTGHLEEGESGMVSDDGVVTITKSDGTTLVYTGEFAKIFYETKVYGEVSVGHYPLKKLYDYFGVDPYAKNDIIPSMTNQQALGNLEYISRLYYEDSFWGSSQRTNFQDYSKYTGELTVDVQNVYEKDINRYSKFSDQEAYYDMPEFKQGDPKWKDMKYGSNTIGKLGCCLTSMSMVCTYFTGDMITPEVLDSYIYSKYNGSLLRDKIAEDFGFHQYTVAERFNVEAVMGELANGRLVIAHIRAGACGTGKYGHFVVLNGFNTSDSLFYVKEPASRLTDPISMAQAAEVFDAYRSYGN